MRPAYSSFFVFYVNECTKAGNYGKLFHRNNERMYAHEKGYYKWKNNDYTVYVGDAAFRNCTDLASVTGTDSLRSVGRGAFDGTAYLNAISDDLVMIGSCLYKYRGSAEDVVVPEGTVSISPECFSFNTDICSITLPDSL